MPDKKAGSGSKKNASASGRENVNELITAKLRNYYDSVVDEGTPDHLLDLLQRLDEAERKFQQKNAETAGE